MVSLPSGSRAGAEGAEEPEFFRMPLRSLRSSDFLTSWNVMDLIFWVDCTWLGLVVLFVVGSVTLFDLTLISHHFREPAGKWILSMMPTEVLQSPVPSLIIASYSINLQDALNLCWPLIVAPEIRGFTRPHCKHDFKQHQIQDEKYFEGSIYSSYTNSV